LPEPKIRPFRREDAEAATPLFRELWSEAVVTPTGLIHYHESQPERAAMRAWVAEDAGAIVGFANARMRWALAEEGIASAWAGVLPSHRRRGLGGRLYELAEAHLRDQRAQRIESNYRPDEPEGRRFAERLGFEETRREQYWALDVSPAEVAQPQPPKGVAVVRLREVRDRERELFDLYGAAERDMPDDHPHELAFEEWLPESLGNPELDLEVSAVVLVDDRPASFAWLVADREGRRAENEMTGTAPDYRRRGLARMAKEATIAWAAEAGIRTILTSNDTTNADMLALNEHLGYKPTVLRVWIAKSL
jgi:GNAT superfamily N-acetyltransferase